MGAIKGFFLVIISVLLFLTIFSTILLGIFGKSLNYNNLETESSIAIKGILENYNLSSQVEKIYPLIQSYCQNNSNYVFSFGEYALDIPCNSALQGTDAILNEGVKSFIHQVYYKEYNCNFVNCFNNSEIPLFLISEKTHNFLINKFYILLTISFILFILLFFAVNKKSNAFIIGGIFSIILSLLSFKLDYLLSSISNKTISSVLKIFFSQSFYVSLWALIMGVILIVLGIVFKIFNIGFFISNLISKIKEKQPIQKRDKKPIKSSVKTKPK
jgi:hypothetical protein